MDFTAEQAECLNYFLLGTKKVTLDNLPILLTSKDDLDLEVEKAIINLHAHHAHHAIWSSFTTYKALDNLPILPTSKDDLDLEVAKAIINHHAHHAI